MTTAMELVLQHTLSSYFIFFAVSIYFTCSLGKQNSLRFQTRDVTGLWEAKHKRRRH